MKAEPLIPWQQLEPVAGATPGTWRSRGVEPQFRRVCALPAGWVRIRWQMACAARARAELRLDIGEGLDAASCIERVSFQGNLWRDFFVKLPWPVCGIRLDPLDMEGEFRLQHFDIQPLSPIAFLAQVLYSAVKQERPGRHPLRALRTAIKLLRGGHRQLKAHLLRYVQGPSLLAPPPYEADQAYEAWRRRRALTPADRERMQSEIAAMSGPPVISLLLEGGESSRLRTTIDSVRQQIYPHWELWLMGESLPLDQGEGRIRRLPNAASDTAALNHALAGATGDYVLLLDSGDELAEHALFRLAQTILQDRHPDLVYSDEDRLDAAGRHHNPFFKPDWSPEYVLAMPYTGRLAAFRSVLVREVGGFRFEFAPAHEYDLVLRMAEQTDRISHIPDVLYHRAEKGPADTLNPAAPQTHASLEEAARRALIRHFESVRRPATVIPGPAPLTFRSRYLLRGRPRVSVIIPTAYRDLTIQGKLASYVERCLTVLRGRSTYPHYEIILLDNGECPAELRDRLAEWGVRRSGYPLPFNWAGAMNEGARLAGGEHLLFLDDDTEVQTPDWLEAMLEFSQQREIGVVGARLQFPDGRLQHTGVTVLGGTPGHPFYGLPASHPGYFNSNLVPRNYSAVTGACLMTRREVFQELGGFDESFATNFNDIDYCLQVRASGRRVVCCPHARLIHYETATKTSYPDTELITFRQRWGRQRDPYYNPNLSSRYHDFRLAAEEPRG
jgi:GT2 family glycosyltransferase